MGTITEQQRRSKYMIEHCGVEYADHAVLGVGPLMDGDGLRDPSSTKCFWLFLGPNRFLIARATETQSVKEQRQSFLACIHRVEQRQNKH